ncbi:MAG: helix-turn-helix transcriptional regulator [Lachnospiraceae bacterium]|nr:helix-turn-helix transcriptional regulator [Lachnospiraceae bacterium]MBP3609224.1 helix-turn-helix transcriptional regulator [Lachnospiraceae bacterium]
MEIGNQIKKYRAELKLSQEELADKIFVTRQTISNWENEKNYPDIKSLVMLSSLFGISLDHLVKGDLEEMKEQIKEMDIQEFNRSGYVYLVLMAAMLFTPIPLVKFLGLAGIIIWGVLAVVTVCYAFKMEKQKKALDIQTYREITAFMEGKRLDEIDKQREIGKRNYQKVFCALGAALIGGIVTAFMLWLLF